jgi:hypothetical protein
MLLVFAFASPLTSVRAVIPAAPVQPKAVAVRFTVFALGGAEGLAYQPKAGDGPKSLKFYSANRSPRYDYHGSEIMSFYDAAAGTQAAPVAIYTIPEGASDVLLLFFPKEAPTASGLKYDVHGVDDRLDKTPAGSFTTINVSGRDYVAHYGGNRISIPQGAGAVYAGKNRVSLMLASQVEGRWMPTGKHDFTMSPRDRVTLIFYPPASRTGVYPIIRRLTEAVPAPLDERGTEMAQKPTVTVFHSERVREALLENHTQ